MTPNEYLHKTHRMITENIYLTLATSTRDGIPWIAPLYFAYDRDCTFYFVSAKDSIHAKHIKQNPRVAFAFYNSTLCPEEVDGVQIEGVASQVQLTELLHALTIYYKRRFPNDPAKREREHIPANFHGFAIRRVFKIVPTAVFTLDPNFNVVDQRVEVSVAALQELLRNGELEAKK